MSPTPNLHLRFVEVDFWKPKSDMSFIDFVDRVLAVSSDSTIRKSDRVLNQLISIIFTCKTIVKLKLGSLVKFAMVPENAYLPSLKTLFFFRVRFSGCEFEALLSACPVLEELTLLGCPWYARQCLTISCTTLERLTLSCKGAIAYSLPWSFSFDTPRLAYLNYHGYIGDEYPIVNLHSLVEAKLSLEYRGSPNEGNPMNLIEGLRNVEVLDLSSLGTSKLLSSFAELIPLFGKLSRVSIATEFQHSCTSWKFLPLLLKKSPNLKTLVIKGPLHFYDEYGEEFEPIICECLSEYSFLSSCHVKILEIIDYGGTKGELGQMKKFLEKLPYLELVNVHASAKAKLTFGTDLQVLLRACNIQLNFFFF
ncbi:hypothetical protein HID58_043118 [Brassica napus]|uniref:FBD domain-containing protein n=1 Tax=Brassica napus TaxID=3708 RepID=A0ABQ8BFP4_BRANA|nr:hypothetical protein HID58_043118 [Brassica napus]